jgi:flavorubredoxin
VISAEDVNGIVLYKDQDHSFIWLGTDSEASSGVIQTNQYLIIDKGRGVLLDPGGIHLFARVVATASRYISLDRIDSIFFSHQDPDVSSGIALWLGITSAKIYVCSLWLRFLPHFGIVDQSRVIGIEDFGSALKLQSGSALKFIPSHFLHSTGNYTVFDERSGILFSADIGAAVFPPGKETVFVGDFDTHLPLIEGFHKRYMASGKVASKWVRMVSALSPKMIAPQHGAIYKDAAVSRFLEWFGRLECGTDLLDSIYKA